MFDFNNLDIVCNTDNIYNSFVGIRRNAANNRMTFFLPKGFDSFEVEYNNVKNLFFAMYKTFKRFEADNLSKFNNMLDKVGMDRDNTYSRNSKGYSFIDDDDNEVLFYSKIDIIDNFFKIYKDLEIDSIVEKMGITEKVDYANIDRLLAEGVFLKNNAIFIDDSLGSKYVIEAGISELVELYSYIYKELIIELEGEPNSLIWEAADSFSYRYLTKTQSLFDEDSYESTILILKDCLDSINRSIPYKDYLYYEIYDVIEQFLYGKLNTDDSSGDFWGINNFSFIWEDICNNFVLSDSTRKVLYCDTIIEHKDFLYNNPDIVKSKSGRHTIYKDNNFDDNFYIEMNDHKRWLRPDIAFSNKYKLEELIAKKLISFEIKSMGKSLSLFGSKVNISLNLNKDILFGLPELWAARNIFKFFKSEFRDLQNKSHPLYLKNKGHRFKEISDNSIQLNSVTEDFFDYICKKLEKDTKEEDIYIVDWKYVPLDFFNKASEKLEIDIIKQLTYEFCITNSKNKTAGIFSQFCIPKYSNNEDLVLDSNNKILSVYEIEVVSLNFNVLQRSYINKSIVLS